MQRAGRNTISLIRSAAGPAVALFVIIYFAGAAIFGQNGLLGLAGYRAERAERIERLHALDAQRATLIHHAALLDPNHVDPDYADELVRRQTGQIRPDEVILPAD
jgi:cell division protein FtsB